MKSIFWGAHAHCTWTKLCCLPGAMWDEHCHLLCWRSWLLRWFGLGLFVCFGGGSGEPVDFQTLSLGLGRVRLSCRGTKRKVIVKIVEDTIPCTFVNIIYSEIEVLCCFDLLLHQQNTVVWLCSACYEISALFLSLLSLSRSHSFSLLLSLSHSLSLSSVPCLLRVVLMFFGSGLWGLSDTRWVACTAPVRLRYVKKCAVSLIAFRVIGEIFQCIGRPVFARTSPHTLGQSPLRITIFHCLWMGHYCLGF